MAGIITGQPTQPYQPFDPTQGQMWTEAQRNWKINPTNYLDDFKGYYNDMLSGYGGLNTGAGLGMYGSDLLNQLTGNISNELRDPNASQAMGLIRDRMSGVRTADQQGLTDRLAGWGRGSGVGQAMMNQSGRQSDVRESNLYRQSAEDITQRAMANAMGLEGMKGGFYESSKDRELQNALYGMNLQGQKSGLLGSLADMMKSMSAQDIGAQQQSFQNVQGLAGQELPREQQGYENQKQDYYNWNQYFNQRQGTPFWGMQSYGGGRTPFSGGQRAF